MNITIYGAPGCAQCLMAKNFLTSRKVDFDYVDITVTRTNLFSITGTDRPTLPVIVVNDEYLSNGYADLVKLINSSL